MQVGLRLFTDDSDNLLECTDTNVEPLFERCAPVVDVSSEVEQRSLAVRSNNPIRIY